MMLAGRFPAPPPSKGQALRALGVFSKRINGVDPRLGELLIDIHLGETHEWAREDTEWLDERQELFRLASRVAVRVGDSAFFEQVARIVEVLNERDFLRSYVLKIGKLKIASDLPLSFIAERVNEWLVNDGKRPVELAVIRNEMKAMRLKYAQPQRGPKKKTPTKRPKKPRKQG
jgi:hypothetical protein